MIRAFIAMGAVALLVAGAATGRPAASPVLKGTVGPGFSISLTQNGHKVTKLKAGTYKLVVSDKASIHNFVLEKSHGGSFERDVTSVGFTGTKMLTVKLTAGTYEYYCRPHESVMHGDFTVS